MSTDHEASEALRLSAGERVLLAALIECPEITVPELTEYTALSVSTVRDGLRRLKSLGAAKSDRTLTLGESRACVLWSATAAVLHLVFVPDVTAASGSGKPTAREKVLTVVRLRPGLPMHELAWATALSRTIASESLSRLEREGLVHRVRRTGRRGGVIADGWVATSSELDELLASVVAASDES